MSVAAASAVHLCLQASAHSSGIFGTMKGITRVVCNLFLFLFVFYRVEEDMVSTKAYFLVYVMKVF